MLNSSNTDFGLSLSSLNLSFLSSSRSRSLLTWNRTTKNNYNNIKFEVNINKYWYSSDKLLVFLFVFLGVCGNLWHILCTEYEWLCEHERLELCVILIQHHINTVIIIIIKILLLLLLPSIFPFTFKFYHIIAFPKIPVGSKKCILKLFKWSKHWLIEARKWLVSCNVCKLLNFNDAL